MYKITFHASLGNVKLRLCHIEFWVTEVVFITMLRGSCCLTIGGCVLLLYGDSKTLLWQISAATSRTTIREHCLGRKLDNRRHFFLGGGAAPLTPLQAELVHQYYTRYIR